LKGQQDKSIHHQQKTNIMTTSTIILPEIKVGLIFHLTPTCKGHLITKIEKNIVYYTDLKHNRNYKNTKTNIKGFLIGFALYNER
jgi:hypothetical protein